MNIKKITKSILPLLTIPFILVGCSKKSECELPSRHVHLYTKNTSRGRIEKYLDSENVTYGDYNWNKDYIEITKDDEEFYKVKGESFEGVNNWDYLFNTMAANNYDYLEFYYHYTTTSTYTTTDGKGHTTTHTQTHHHSGWSKDPTHRGVNGEVRLNHHRFYGYKIIYKNGKYIKERSPLVDDIRDIIDEYPYYNDDCVEIIYKEYGFNKSELTRLKAEDFHYFNKPDLSKKELNTNTK